MTVGEYIEELKKMECGLRALENGNEILKPEDIVYELFTTGKITLEEYLRSQESPSETLNLLITSKHNEYLRTKDK